jgi:hypothetical protein
MIAKVNANGKVTLHPALAGCLFKVEKQPDGGLRLKWKGRRIGGRIVRDAATKALFRKLSKPQRKQPA